MTAALLLSSGCNRRIYGESGAIACTNGVDDDGDGLIDCADSDCAPTCMANSCGDGVADLGEDCDGGDLAGESCTNLGFTGGTLGCSGACLFDTSGCTGGGTCGDGTCDATETCTSCVADCGTCNPVCGDGTCDATETCTSCSSDCGSCGPTCGDGTCDAGETCSSCSSDCGSCGPVCGNGSCEAGETCSSCSSDCGSCGPVCGNGSCEAGETCSSCSTDCGACGPVCGNFLCEAGETCGTCPTDCSGFYFSEDFANNSAGWTLGTEWAIGATSAGSTSDPATDHTSATTDNGVAGMVLGGNYSAGIHAPYYLTSPIMNTSGASTLYLDYYRWLNSDYTPYVINTIDVYDGFTWVNVFSTGSSATNDASWQYFSYDISAYANASMQVRWGFEVLSGSAYADGGWNVDDVEIYDPACTP